MREVYLDDSQGSITGTPYAFISSTEVCARCHRQTPKCFLDQRGLCSRPGCKNKDERGETPSRKQQSNPPSSNEFGYGQGTWLGSNDWKRE